MLCISIVKSSNLCFIDLGVPYLGCGCDLSKCGVIFIYRMLTH